MDDGEFRLRRQAAVESMREMSARSRISEEYKGGERKKALSEESCECKKSGKDFALPQNKGAFISESDTALLLGLLLILISENADKALLIALIYILM